jgi:hypothetical protein
VWRQRASLRVHALAQRRAGGQQRDAQRVLVELVAPMVLDRVEVALALDQQAQVAAHDVAVAHAGAHRQGRIQPRQHRRQSLEMVSHQCQPGYRREVVLELPDFDRAHTRIVSAGERSFNYRLTQWVRAYRGEVTDSGSYFVIRRWPKMRNRRTRTEDEKSQK